MSKNPRYDGKPMLRILECYVLDAIGELSTEDAVKLAGMTPQLERVFARRGTWQEVIQGALQLPDTILDSIRRNYALIRADVIASGQPFDAQTYAERFVDANFPLDD